MCPKKHFNVKKGTHTQFFRECRLGVTREINVK